ncbi:MAG: sugar transferase [Calditrichaeota bacterium]|nr:sugar transferase [Calditrichota bacterium]
MKNLVSQFCKNLRETDAVSLFNKERIVILLPETDLEGAQYVNKILHQQINQFIQENSGRKIFTPDEFTVEIIPFPDSSLDDDIDERKNSVKLPNQGTNDYVSGLFSKNKFHYQNSLPTFINACVGRNDGSALIMEIANRNFINTDILEKTIYDLQLGIKRVFDFLAALLLLIILAPVFATIALVIKLTSEGPVIFTQKRVGFNGKLFKFYKFRTMYNNNDEHIHKKYIQNLISGKYDSINNGSNDDPLFKLKNDPRITAIGRFLRKTSLDELPQLWNVLKGEMSLIGPRPPIPYEVEAYEPWHLRRVQEVKPGITGLWQVSGRNKLTFDDQVRLDIKYVKSWSFFLDLKILLKTIPVLIFFTGN